MGRMARGSDPDTVIDQWLERDLSVDAAAGDLPAAFEADAIVDALSQTISAGRHPILVGESGVGKTAAVYELIRRVAAGDGPPELQSKRVLQFSLRARASSLRKPDDIRPEMQKLADALALRSGIVPFFRDADLARDMGLEPQLLHLPVRLGEPVLLEVSPARYAAMLEGTPEFEQSYSAVLVAEPDLDRAHRILSAWAAD